MFFTWLGLPLVDSYEPLRRELRRISRECRRIVVKSPAADPYRLVEGSSPAVSQDQYDQWAAEGFNDPQAFPVIDASHKD